MNRKGYQNKKKNCSGNRREFQYEVLFWTLWLQAYKTYFPPSQAPGWPDKSSPELKPWYRWIIPQLFQQMTQLSSQNSQQAKYPVIRVHSGISGCSVTLHCRESMNAKQAYNSRKKTKLWFNPTFKISSEPYNCRQRVHTWSQIGSNIAHKGI